jgi:hypothetical protein
MLVSGVAASSDAGRPKRQADTLMPAGERTARRRLTWPGGRGAPVVIALVAATLTLAALGLSGMQALAQARDVAYVESVAGRALAASEGTTAELDALDPLNDGTRLDLETNAVLKLCHYRTHTLFTLKGPLRASISVSGVTTESGAAIAASRETCAAPVLSTFQGGLALRGLWDAASVGLRPRIRIINRGSQTIRKAALWDAKQQTAIATFDRTTMAQPQLIDGQNYSLVVDFADGSEWKAIYRASAATPTSTVIVVLR